MMRNILTRRCATAYLKSLHDKNNKRFEMCYMDLSFTYFKHKVLNDYLLVSLMISIIDLKQSYSDIEIG